MLTHPQMYSIRMPVPGMYPQSNATRQRPVEHMGRASCSCSHATIRVFNIRWEEAFLWHWLYIQHFVSKCKHKALLSGYFQLRVTRSLDVSPQAVRCQDQVRLVAFSIVWTVPQSSNSRSSITRLTWFQEVLAQGSGYAALDCLCLFVSDRVGRARSKQGRAH